MRLNSSPTRTGTRVVQATLVACLAVGLMAGTVFAAKPAGGGGGGKPSGGGGGIALAMVADWNANGAPNWSDQVRFTISTSNAYPIVSVTCTKGGTLVYADSRPYYWPNIWDDPGTFTLASLAWSSGAADCRADLKGSSNRGTVTLGSTTFFVGA